MPDTTKNSMNLDWAEATEAAERILKACRESAFAAPENHAAHHAYAVKVADQMTALAAALRISRR